LKTTYKPSIPNSTSLSTNPYATVIERVCEEFFSDVSLEPLEQDQQALNRSAIPALPAALGHLLLRSHAHADASQAMTPLTYIGLARFEHMLAEGRKELGSMFTAAEFEVLLMGHQGRYIALTQPQHLVALLCEELELRDWRQSRYASLIERVLQLSTLQYTALADALETVWHTGRAPTVTLEALGIDFRLH